MCPCHGVVKAATQRIHTGPPRQAASLQDLRPLAAERARLHLHLARAALARGAVEQLLPRAAAPPRAPPPPPPAYRDADAAADAGGDAGAGWAWQAGDERRARLEALRFVCAVAAAGPGPACCAPLPPPPE